MSGLLNGADCSVNSNPLNNVLKREGVDNSVFRVSAVSLPFVGSLNPAPSSESSGILGHPTSHRGVR